MKAIVFDIGQTLTYYPVPLNWSKLYRPAFGSVAEKLGIQFTEEEYTHFGEVLTKYNTTQGIRNTRRIRSLRRSSKIPPLISLLCRI